MAAPPQESVEMRDFPGLMDNIDPEDIPPAAAEDQVNCCSIISGELLVRLGFRQVSFD